MIIWCMIFAIVQNFCLFSATSISLFNSTSTTVSVGTNPLALAVTPNGKFLYVANSFSNTVSVIDTATNRVKQTVSGFTSPNSITINSAGTKAYVTNSGANTVSVVNLATNTIVATIVGFNVPTGMAINSAGTFGYVSNYGNGTVSYVNLTTNAISGLPIVVGNFPLALAITPNGSYVYVANYVNGIAGQSTVSVIKTSNNSVIKTISGFWGPQQLAITPDSLRVYVPNFGNSILQNYGNTVSVIDADPRSKSYNMIVDTITVGSQPFGITINPSGNYAFVTLYASGAVGSLVTIQLSDNSVLTPSYTLGKGPAGVFVTPNGLGLYVANYDANNVQALSFINSLALSLFNFTGSISFFVSNMFQNAYPLLQTIGYVIDFFVPFTNEQNSFYFNVPVVMHSQYCIPGVSGVDCSMTPLNIRVFIVGGNGNNFYFDIPYANLPGGPNSLNIDFAGALQQIASGQTITAQLINALGSYPVAVNPSTGVKSVYPYWAGTLFTISTNVVYSNAA